MTGGNGFRAGLAGLICFAGSGLVFAGDNLCHSAPRCWTYHRDVCFGYYQTKWRRWDDACGQQPRPAFEVPQFSKSTRTEAPQSASFGTPKTLSVEVATTVKKPVEESPSRMVEHSPPPAARLVLPVPLAEAQGAAR